jgi:hypothetical protein
VQERKENSGSEASGLLAGFKVDVRTMTFTRMQGI